ncbi:helix-turn-helix domain-containing protein [Marinoscillum furvescens]|uniref:Helix-turn-helix protein n=1 Tax=Marinoscillum furvescens DSM 4134 TaxID=1122208 RepID=A0A3D9LH09_MARFU|nr:helix-turn-helix transcriptional regulator [Marinoscillum furvescens]REE05917.1 helix-turn-helix protein [Marinoscillum furvescens DSM 4134]
MSKEIFELKFIFGLKLKEIRQQKGLSYQELKERSGLSLSYLSEIENGKKYPKGDKIMVLAEALDVSYDELVSLQVPTKLKPVVTLIRSDFFKAFPMEQFGLNPQKLVEIISYDPEKINSFLKTMLQVARNYELKQENFYQAALRSYQELNQNYFDELEDEVDGLRLEFPELGEIPFNEKLLSSILMKIGVRIEFDAIARKKPTLSL